MKKKVYICDCCGKQINNPYKEKMREFLISYSREDGIIVPYKWSAKSKVHLCDSCFKQIAEISLNKKED